MSKKFHGDSKVFLPLLISLLIVVSLFLLLDAFTSPSTSQEDITMDFLQKYLKNEFFPQKINLVYGRPPWENEGYYYGMIWNVTPNEEFHVYLKYNSNEETLSHIFVVVYPDYYTTNALPEDYFVIPSQIEWDCSVPEGINLSEGFTDCRASWPDENTRIDSERLLIEEQGSDVMIMMNVFKMFPESDVFELKFGKVKE